jgi:hypothetical protein
MLLGKIKFANKEYDSVEGVLRAYYYNTTGNELANYRGKIICLTLEEGDESLYSNLVNQLNQVDEELEVK